MHSDVLIEVFSLPYMCQIVAFVIREVALANSSAFRLRCIKLLLRILFAGASSSPGTGFDALTRHMVEALPSAVADS